MKKNSHNHINSLAKAFRVIELLANERELGVAELGRMLGFPKTTVFRILITLEELGYVRKNPANLRYMATFKFFEVGSKVVERLSIMDIAHPFMIELAQKTGETINLGVLDGLDIVCVDKVESAHILKMDQPIGNRVRAYYSAFGKAVLAHLPKEERTRLLAQDTIKPATSGSLKTAAAIEKELQRVLQTGFSVDKEEGRYGICCVGAPIFDYKKEVIAGISIAGPASRIKEKGFECLGEMVMKTAAAISERLGGAEKAGSIGGDNGQKKLA